MQKRIASSLILLALMLITILASTPLSTANLAYAQKTGDVDEVTGYTEARAGLFYLLPNLKKGQTVYFYANSISGNLDPLIALGEADLDNIVLRDKFYGDVQKAIDEGRDPLLVVPEFAEQIFLAWDDDGGTGHDAALEFEIPADGDYRLLVTSSPGTQSFGDFRLLVGIDAPQVLTGQAEPTGAKIAELDVVASQVNVAVEEVTGSLTENKRTTFFDLHELDPGDTVYVYVEATSGDLAPVLLLNDFSNKPLRSGNYSGQQSTTSLEYTFEEGGSNYQIRLNACCEGSPATTGDYRLLVGINQPDVLTGQAQPTEKSILQRPTEVKVGIKMEQITGVDQKSENFGAVVDMRMEWHDPKLAFNPDECNCRFQTFTIGSFTNYLSQKGVVEWPSFTLFNQQGRRDSQNQLLVVGSNGDVIYVERFSATLQAPDFYFGRFPFDTQDFYIRLRLVFPEEFFVYTDLEGFSGLGDQLGEEEWIIKESDTFIDTFDGSSRFNYHFDASRHLTFYLFRIFVPVIIIIIVSWFTFFLRDYGKRVEVASGNLLLFIAFNFTISNDLPRLGYLTFLDTILVSTFIVTALVIVFNVYFKRLEVDNKKSRAQKVDQYMIWVYPIAYVLAFVIVSFFFT